MTINCSKTLVKIFRDQRFAKRLNSTIQEQQKCNSKFNFCTIFKKKGTTAVCTKKQFKIRLFNVFLHYYKSTL